MTPRERVLAALEHRQPDRAPMDVGTTRFTGIVKGAYDKLRAHLGFGGAGVLIDRMQQVVEPDKRVLEHLGVDARGFSQGTPDRGGDIELGDHRYQDEWGVVRRQPPGCPYYELERSPLVGEITAQTVARYPWPDPTDPGIVRGLREAAQRLRQSGYAVIYNGRFNLVHTTQYLRGFEDWFMDMGQNHALFRGLMQAVWEVLREMNRRTLREVGDLIDIVAFGDDIGQQDRPVCAPALYRQLLRPFQEQVVETIRAHTRAKILYHTCGSVYRYVEDFIAIGIDVLNPIQVSAKDMEPGRLKREFGDRINFWGGIDTQRILPRGSAGEVRSEVRRIFELMGSGGGWVLGAVHNIQPDVPPENICALFEAGRECIYEQEGGSR